MITPKFYRKLFATQSKSLIALTPKIALIAQGLGLGESVYQNRKGLLGIDRRLDAGPVRRERSRLSVLCLAALAIVVQIAHSSRVFGSF